MSEIPPGTALLVADLRRYESVAKTSAELATKLAGLLQQYLGEAVYLFDGRIVDPFGNKVVAQLPDVDAAIRAALRAKSDVLEHNREHPAESLDIRFVVHFGDAQERGMAIRGAGVDEAMTVLALFEPLHVIVTPDAMMHTGRPWEMREMHGMSEVLGEQKPKPVAPPAESHERAIHPAAAAGEGAAAARARSRAPLIFGMAAVVLLVIIASGVGFVMRKRAADMRAAEAERAIAEAKRRAAVEQEVRAVAIAPFTIEATDPKAQEDAQAIRASAIAMLKTIPEAVIVDGSQKGAHEFGATVRNAASGVEIVNMDRLTGAAARPVPVTGAGSAAAEFAQWVASQAKLRGKLGLSADAQALDSFVAAVQASGAGDEVRAAQALKAATQKDPSFLAAQIFALDFFARQGDYVSAIEAGSRATALAPDDIEVARRLARIDIAASRPEDALPLYRRIASRKSNDPEALGTLAKYALSVGDEAMFASLLKSANASDPATTLHDGDALLFQSKFDGAVEKYYATESNVQNNPVLSLKIGRIAVLRHSLPIADLELKKLATLDPGYGTPLLEAYIAAENRDQVRAEAKLQQAAAGVDWRNDFNTSSAEIYAILNQPGKTIEALKKAVAKGEPTAAYILSNPLFRYLQTEPEFANVRRALAARQGSIRASLSGS